MLAYGTDFNDFSGKRIDAVVEKVAPHEGSCGHRENEQIKPQEHQGGAGQSWQERADSERGVRRSNVSICHGIHQARIPRLTKTSELERAKMSEMTEYES